MSKVKAIKRNHQAEEPEDPKAKNPRDDAYHWLSEVEALCRKAFVPDEVIIARSQVKIASRSRPLKKVKIDAPKKEKGQLHVISVSESMDSWLRRLDAPLSPEDEQKAGEKASIGMANRDLLAHRIGRPNPSIRWQGCPTDMYDRGARSYRRRLANVGREIASLGWIGEPSNHPWRPKTNFPLPGKSDEQREADAQRNAEMMTGEK